MKQGAFEASRDAGWRAFEVMLADAERGRSKLPAAVAEDFVRHYRAVCQDLAAAQSRSYGPALVDRLNGLARRGHACVYSRSGGLLVALREFLLRDFPVAVRREWRYVLAATLLFVLPALAIGLAIVIEPNAVYVVMDPGNVRAMEDMYRPGLAVHGEARDAEDDFMMLGFYVFNNIGIGFQCFATGLLFGLGPLFYLTFNGTMIGAVTAHLASNGFGSTFFPFVIGHGAFELTGIVLSGAAGLQLGMALVAPGRQRRVDALVARGRIAMELVFGVFLLLLVAAFVESFWSARTLVPGWTRLVVGAVFWVLVLGYFILAGRPRTRQERPS